MIVSPRAGWRGTYAHARELPVSTSNAFSLMPAPSGAGNAWPVGLGAAGRASGVRGGRFGTGRGARPFSRRVRTPAPPPAYADIGAGRVRIGFPPALPRPLPLHSPAPPSSPPGVFTFTFVGFTFTFVRCIYVCAFTFAFVRSHLCAQRAHISAPVRYYRGNFACPRLGGFTRPFGSPRPASAAPALLLSLPRLRRHRSLRAAFASAAPPRAPQRLPVATSPRQTAAPPVGRLTVDVSGLLTFNAI